MEKNKKKIIIITTLLSVLCLLIFICSYFSFIDYKRVSVYNGKVFSNIYLDNYKLEGVNINSLNDVIDKYSDEFLKQTFIININEKEYSYRYIDIGLSVNKEQIVKDILTYQNNMNYFDKVTSLNHKKKKVFNISYLYNKDTLVTFMSNIKSIVDTVVVNGGFVVDDNRNVTYSNGVNGFSLDVNKSLDILIKQIDSSFSDKKITFVGDTVPSTSNDSYKTVDTKVSSFTTTFDTWISRATNLKSALAYIDGAIIEPGEVFSFYKYAGPYNKKGYVFYYEFVGNGVCQIATTVYNAALLGGLEIVKRYPHDKKSVYVDGGLDATVASYASGWNVDMQFKNTYKYPIYISAYTTGGVAHVDFWSNSNATEGKTYSTESVKIGNRGYTTYLHTFKDGVEINKSLIATTWYTKD